MKILEFYNESCGACKLLIPILTEISNEYKCELELINLDHPLNKEYIERYNIKTLPHVRIEIPNEDVIEFSGFRPYGAINKMIKGKSE